MVLGPTTFDNHLSTVFTVRISVRFHSSHAPTKVWVASLRGLPRSIFYVSIKTSSLWHFQVYFDISKDLAILTAVTPYDVPRLMNSPSTNTTGITASASMDFPHGRDLPRDYPKIAQLIQTLFLDDLFSKNFFFQAIETAKNVKVCCRGRSLCLKKIVSWLS